MNQNKFPPGWDEERVKTLLAHYEEQSEDEAVAEDEAAYEEPNQTVMEVPTTLVPAIRELIAKHQASAEAVAPRRLTLRSSLDRVLRPVSDCRWPAIRILG